MCVISTSAIVHLANICLNNGTFPKTLEITVIKPILKSGNQTLLNNYRPISVLPYISKMLEKITFNRPYVSHQWQQHA